MPSCRRCPQFLVQDMKKLRWCIDKESSEYMRTRKSQNKKQCLNSAAESWMAELLKKNTAHKWTRQIIWGYRLFDFWNHILGVVVEVDGPEHRKDYDAYRDEYAFRRSGIVVLRVRNWNEEDASAALKFIAKANTAIERKIELGIKGNDKKCRTSLAKLNYPPSLLSAYLSGSIQSALMKLRPVNLNRSAHIVANFDAE